MDDLYVAKPLGTRQIDQAFPIVSAFVPELQVDRWRSFAASLMATGAARRAARAKAEAGVEEDGSGLAGIMTVQSRRGYIHGLFCYAVEEHLRHGRVLEVDNFVVMDMFDADSVALVLLRSMDQLARAFNCQAIHTQIPGAPGHRIEDDTVPLLRAFRQDGHMVENLRLCKPLDGANDNSDRPARAAEP